MNALGTAADIYRDGRYLRQHPEWHAEHSGWKAAQVLRMIERARLHPKTVGEVGCGAGDVLRRIQQGLDGECVLRGFDISPQAISLSQPRANDRLAFELIASESEISSTFDLLIAVDVIEHVEDYIGFLRCIRSKGKYKILHVPLDVSVQTVFRRKGLLRARESHAHLHYFTRETFLRILTDLGYQVHEVAYSRRSLEIGSGLRQALINVPRRVGFWLNQDLTARVLGGFSLMVLAT